MRKYSGYDNHSASACTSYPGSELFAPHSPVDGKNEHSESWCDGGVPSFDSLPCILGHSPIVRAGSEWSVVSRSARTSMCVRVLPQGRV